MGKFYEGLRAELVEYAKGQFSLTPMVGKGGARTSRRAALENLASQGDDDALNTLASLPELPPHLDYLWTYFLDLDQTRPANGFGACRLSRQEIAQWERDEGVSLAHWERRALLQVDAAFVGSQQQSAEAGAGDEAQEVA